MTSFAQFGNELYTGKRSIEFIGRLKTWLLISLVLLAVVIGGVKMRGLNFGIEFTGGSDFRVTSVANADGYENRAREVVSKVGGVEGAKVTLVGNNDVRVETEQMDDRKAQDVSSALAKEFGVGTDHVRSAVVGPSWGASVSQKAFQALIIFFILVSILLAVYFRTWKMAAAALLALFHDILLTVGVYSLAGLEVTPASMIGFLTILGYSLYDTVVVFDKVRENTTEAISTRRRTFSEAANLAVNQTLVRSINTSVVALLPVAAILVMGFTVIGPGTLLDLALALFVGIAVGTYSSIFLAPPIYAWLREREPKMKELAQEVERRRRQEGERALAGDDEEGLDANRTGRRSSGAHVESRHYVAATDDDVERTVTGRPIHPSLAGRHDQPRRSPRSTR